MSSAGHTCNVQWDGIRLRERKRRQTVAGNPLTKTCTRMRQPSCHLGPTALITRGLLLITHHRRPPGRQECQRRLWAPRRQW